jgi:hypothetical protein
MKTSETKSKDEKAFVARSIEDSVEKGKRKLTDPSIAFQQRDGSELKTHKAGNPAF